jgi:hypothetical protein
MTEPIDYPYDVQAIIDDIKLSLEAMELHCDRSPLVEMWHILREHGVPPGPHRYEWKWNATPECKELQARWRACQRAYRDRVRAMILDGKTQSEIQEALGFASNQTITTQKRCLGVPVATRRDWSPHVAKIQRLFRWGYTVPEVAELYGVTTSCMRTCIDRNDIEVPRCQSRVAIEARNRLRATRGLPPLVAPIDKGRTNRRHHEVG